MPGRASDALPGAALRWVEGVVGSPVEVRPATGGGISGTTWCVRPAEGGRLALRWSDPVRWGATGREHVRREAATCRLLDGTGIRAPRLVAHDPDGTLAGAPANLTTWLDGRVRLDPLAPAAVRGWAREAVRVHRQPVPAPRRPPELRFRGPADPVVPAWTRQPGLWREAIRRRAAGPPPTTYGLVHRDLHLGNTLWTGDEVSGLVDWTETSWGPPDLDVAHACADLAMVHAVEVAAGFRAAYLAEGGRLEADPDGARFWVVADVLGFLPDPAHILPALARDRPDLTAEDVRHGLEDLLAVTLD